MGHSGFLVTIIGPYIIRYKKMDMYIRISLDLYISVSMRLRPCVSPKPVEMRKDVDTKSDSL